MSRWPLRQLGEVAEVIMGQSPPGSSYNGTGQGIPFIQGSAEFGRQSPLPEKWCTDPRKLAESGDLLVSVRAPVGDMNVANQRTAIGRGLAIVRGKADVTLTDYLSLAIGASADELISRSGGGMFASITKAGLWGLPVPIPLLEDQRRIVDLAEAVDAVIRRAIATRVACVNAIDALRSAAFDTPAHVVETSLGHLCEKGGIQIGPFGSQLHASDYIDDGVPSVMPKNLTRDRIDPAGIARVGVDDWKRLRKHQLQVGDIVLPRRGDLTKRALVTDEEAGWLCGTGSVRVRLAAHHDPEVIFESLSSTATDRWLQDNAVGITMPNLNTEIVSRLPVRIPTNDARPVIDLLLAQRHYRLRLEEFAASARQARSAILSDLLTGLHTIPDSYDALLDSI